MKPTIKPTRTAEQRAEEAAIRRQHAANPVRQRPTDVIKGQSFTAILSLVARFKAVRESQGLTLAEVAERMGIDPPALSRLETGKMLNPTLATLHKWAEALGQQLGVNLSHIPHKPLTALLSQKRKQWLKALTGEDRHSIRNQIAIMTWAVAAYRVVNEARRLAPAAPEGGVQLNGLMHNLLDRGFLSSHALAVRRLVDGETLTGKRGVYSLLGILKDMCDHSDLFTRAAMLDSEGVGYDFEELLQQDPALTTGFVAHGAPRASDRHEVIDRLTNSNPSARKPGDVIPKAKFEIMKERVISISDRIKKHVDKFIAHAATPESRASVQVTDITLADLWKAHETLCRVAACLAHEFLGVPFPPPLPDPFFDQFAYIDRPLVTPEQVSELRTMWEAFADESQNWISLAVDESE
ncbi:MAG: helix-turn-helix domain-containing protein [Planctomycetia bacterium]|nr:helix-turn-helix domain-containing protein [Planctomycetia bacterium]